MTTNSQSVSDRARELLKGITPGPWFDSEAGEWLTEPKELLSDYNTAVFIAAAPELVSELLDRIVALTTALSSALPRCDFVIDRDHGTPCNDIAVYAGSFGQHYCEDHNRPEHRLMPVVAEGFAILFGRKPESAALSNEKE